MRNEELIFGTFFVIMFIYAMIVNIYEYEKRNRKL